METVVQDLRYTARNLARQPGFAATAILTLALGVGGTTAIFSVVNAVVVRPLPYSYPDLSPPSRLSGRTPARVRRACRRRTSTIGCGRAAASKR